jgi:hypothetical protein
MRKLLDRLIAGLAEDGDLDGLLKKLGATPRQAAHALASRRARSLVETRRMLAQVQVELQASLYAARAVALLRKMMEEEEKPHVQLRAAVALLSLARPRKEEQRSAEETLPSVNAAAAKEYLAEASPCAIEHKREEMMGAPPEKEEAGSGNAGV